jgi:hypothetical protein
MQSFTKRRMSLDNCHFYLLTSIPRIDLSSSRKTATHICITALTMTQYGAAIYGNIPQQRQTLKCSPSMYSTTDIFCSYSLILANIHRNTGANISHLYRSLWVTYYPFINDSVGSSGYAVSDTRIREWWTENDLVRGGGSLNSGATLTVAWKNYVLTQGSRLMDRDLIPGPPECDIQALTTRQSSSVAKLPWITSSCGVKGESRGLF